MGTMHRKNKSTAVRHDSQHEPWFLARRKRERRRKEIAHESRKRNRPT